MDEETVCKTCTDDDCQVSMDGSCKKTRLQCDKRYDWKYMSTEFLEDSVTGKALDMSDCIKVLNKLEQENERLKDAIRATYHEGYSRSPRECNRFIESIIAGDCDKGHGDLIKQMEDDWR